jgi:predicted RNA-binding Zn ribbon-like protein
MQDLRPPALFIADSPAIDFLNSIGILNNDQVEWIADGEDLISWLNLAKLVPAEFDRALRKNSVPGELDAVAVQARALREWFRSFIHDHKGKPLKRGVLPKLEPLNKILARDEEFGQIGTSPERSGKSGRSAKELIWIPQRRWRSPETVLQPIAVAMARLVCEEDFTFVKACEGSSCSFMFFDRTRARARRWCRMDVCGNRAKQAAYRARL